MSEGHLPTNTASAVFDGGAHISAVAEIAETRTCERSTDRMCSSIYYQYHRYRTLDIALQFHRDLSRTDRTAAQLAQLARRDAEQCRFQQ